MRIPSAGYYLDHLSAERLQRCYDVAPPRVRQYLQAELGFVLQRVRPGDVVLDLGCGYGRILPALASKARFVIGIDTSPSSLNLGQDLLRNFPNCMLGCMDAAHLAFCDQIFDRVICIQNGISAFHTDQRRLMSESLRVLKPGGTALYSTYSRKFWRHRLEWFRLQAKEGLVGEIDEKKTRDGCIVCKDGFTATTLEQEEFLNLASGCDAQADIVEVDESSLFCLLRRT